MQFWYVLILYIFDHSLKSIEIVRLYLDQRTNDDSSSIHHGVVWFICTEAKQKHSVKMIRRSILCGELVGAIRL